MVLKPWKAPLYPLIVVREKVARGERRREVGGEPAVMDEPQGVEEYDAIGTALEVGVHEFSARAISRLLPEGGTHVDLGCGSARLLARLARGRPDARIIGLDLSEPMLETGRANLRAEGLSDRVELRRGDITTFDSELDERPHVVSCNYALHHLPDEDVALRCLEAIARVRSRTGCGVWIFDFARLRNPKAWPAFVGMLNWPGPVVRSDAIESERAAFSFGELDALLQRAGLGELEHLRARPLGEAQIAWAARRDSREPVTGLWRGEDLRGELGLLFQGSARAFSRSLSQT